MAISKEFVLAGKSIFTLEIPDSFRNDHCTKPHYTFRVQKKAANEQYPETYFVQILSGTDNTYNYSYLGILNKETGEVFTTTKSKFDKESWVVKLLNRSLARVWDGDSEVLEQFGFKLHHEGRCGRCGRVLTVPESCATGIGPECRGKL